MLECDTFLYIRSESSAPLTEQTMTHPLWVKFLVCEVNNARRRQSRKEKDVRVEEEEEEEEEQEMN